MQCQIITIQYNSSLTFSVLKHAGNFRRSALAIGIEQRFVERPFNSSRRNNYFGWPKSLLKNDSRPVMQV